MWINIDTITDAIIRDGARFRSYEEKQILGKKRKFATFECHCGTRAEKAAWAIINKGGAYCDLCTQANALKKRRTTVSRLTKRTDVCVQIWLHDDEGAHEVSADASIDLRLAPSSFNPKITAPQLKPRCLSSSRDVTWWDAAGAECRQRSRRFLYPEEDELAIAWHAEKFEESAGAEVIITRSFRQIIEKQQWYQKHFRVHLQPVFYSETQLPLEAYFMGAW